MIGAAQSFLLQRRRAIESHPSQIGVDFVTVHPDPGDPGRRRLDLHFVPGGGGSKHEGLENLGPDNLLFRVGDVPVDGLFELENVGHEPMSDQVSLELRLSGDPELIRQLGAAPVFTLGLADVPNLDPFFSRVEFSLDVRAPLDIDHQPAEVCRSDDRALPQSPAIDYLAKDFWSFREQMICRLSELLPDWEERSPGDLMITLLETLAYAADELSYYQDAAATEAYLGSCRRRISARRHARLLGYHLGEGSNARIWACVETGADGLRLLAGTGTLTSNALEINGTGTEFLEELEAGDVITAAGQSRRVGEILAADRLRVDEPFDPPLADGTPFDRSGAQRLTRTSLPSQPPLAPGSAEARRAFSENPVVFETIVPATLYVAHNRIRFYDWGAAAYRLPAGCLRAVLVGRLSQLEAGDVLVLEEVLGAETGRVGDADPEHRHAVRLTRVQGAEDLLETSLPADAGNGTLESTGTAVTGTGSTFTTDLRVGDMITASSQSRRVIDVVDDTRLTLDAPFVPDLPSGTSFELGRFTEVEWHAEDALPFDLCISALLADGTRVPEVSVARGNVVLADHGRTVSQVDPGGGAPRSDSIGPPLVVPEAALLAPRCRLPLEGTDLTFRTPYDPARDHSMSAAATLTQDPGRTAPVMDLRDPQGPWISRTDLLASDRFARDFVVEIDNGRQPVLRFGDGELGIPPAAGERLSAVYRVGNGPAGNVGPDSLGHAVVDPALAIVAVRNPLPAQGGTAPETLAQVRLGAPGTLRGRTRETPQDSFLRVVTAHPEVQRATVDLAWNGSWHRLRVAVERPGGRPVDEEFRGRLLADLESHRLASWELQIDALELVPLDIALTTFLTADAVRGDVERRLRQTFSNRELPDGSRGFFHPDNFTLGESVYLSSIVRAALEVPGVRALDTEGSAGRRNRFQRFGQPPRGELESGQIRLSGLELARVDNDPTAPQNGTIRFFLEGGR